jgi:class 3 adenylate cyclase
LGEGFESVYVLANGLDAWKQAGFPTTPVDPTAPACSSVARESIEPPPQGSDAQSQYAHAFLPGLVENYANQHKLPMQRELTVLFVDIADSTSTLLNTSPEQTLAFVQRFMGIVTEVALSACGDVKDYEGDGALLYFESVSDAVEAALEMREILSSQPPEGGFPFRARFSLDVGEIVIGIIGTTLRRSVALIGPSINMAARLLKHIPPDGIIATEAIVERLRVEIPAIAERFELLDQKLELKGFEQQCITAYSIP